MIGGKAGRVRTVEEGEESGNESYNVVVVASRGSTVVLMV